MVVPFTVPGTKESPRGTALGGVYREARPVTKGCDFIGLVRQKFRVRGKGEEVIRKGQGTCMILPVLFISKASIVVAVAPLVEPA